MDHLFQRGRNENNVTFTRHWGDTFVPAKTIQADTVIKRPSQVEFTAYNQSTGKKYRKYAKHKFQLDKQKQKIEEHHGTLNTDEIPDIFLDPHFSITNPVTFTSIFLIPTMDESDIFALNVDRSSLNFTGTQSNYSLSRKDSSSSIASKKSCFEYLDSSDLFGGRSFRSHAFLNTKLEYHHDLVGALLNGQLESKSQAFWGTVNSINSVHSELTEGKKQVSVVRTNLDRIKRNVYDKSVKIIDLQQAKTNKEKLLKKLNNIACLKDAQLTVQLLLNQNDYANALDCIEMSQDVLSNDLKGVVCFRHLGVQLGELEKAIAKMLQEEFVYLIQKEFGQSGEVEVTYREGQLHPVVVGLLRVRLYRFIHLLKEEIMEAIKNLIRQIVKNHVVMCGKDMTDLDPSSTHNLTQQMKKMDFIQWFETLRDLFAALVLFCKKIQSIQELILENVERVRGMRLKDKEAYGNSKNSNTQSEKSELESGSYESISSKISMPVKDLNEFKMSATLLIEYCVLSCQERVVKLLDGKTKNSFIEQCTSVQFSMLCNLISEFADDCWGLIKNCNNNSVSSISSWSLTQCIHMQRARFIAHFHETRSKRLDDLLTSEKWLPIKVPAAYQMFMDSSMAEGKLRLTEEMLNCEDKAEQSFLLVDNDKYSVNGAALGLLTMLAEYVTTLEMFPDTAPEMLMNVIQILRVFNSKTCQLLLGAGALTVSSLKTISVKNLALAIRCLQLVIKVIPMVEKEFQTHLQETNKNQLRYFTQGIKDFDDHINEITSKIMTVVEYNMLTSFQAWKVKPKLPSMEIQNVSRQLNKLHMAVTEIMPNSIIEKIFKHVHASFLNCFKQMLLKYEIGTDDPLNYGLAEQEFDFYMLSIKAFPYSQDIPKQTIGELLKS
uniref:Vacuolar protein sorting-associated protein 54 n=1 Tax=Rhabditophanes sp. KR3021 TaxID=114890 RepID=A0AC35TV51_9BILA